MATTNKLHNTTGGTALREAMKALGDAYGIKDKNTFVQLLLNKAAEANSDGKLHADEVEETYETNPQLKELADTIISLQGDGKFGHEIIAAVIAYCDGGGDDPVANALKNEPDDSTAGKENGIFMSITQSGPVNGTPTHGFLRDKGVDNIVSAMGQVHTEDESRRAVSVIEFHHPLLNFANRDSAASSIFLQALPSIEISKAVPYFDMKAIVKGDPIVESTQVDDDSASFGNGISIYKFLSGERIEADDKVVKDLVSAIPVEMVVPPLVLEGQAGEDFTPETQVGKLTVAGMEVFTAPQTMARGDWKHIDLDATDSNYGPDATPRQIPQENKILDKFRPFMTVESFNVTVTPATGMLATKSAEVKVKLHDKTRLNQVIPLISPAKLGLCDIQIEWGWSHPEPRPEVNPYGALINSMRCKELWGVYNSSYTFTPEGQVDISLKLFSKGAQKATFELITNDGDGQHPADVIKNAIQAIRQAMKSLKSAGYTMNEEMGAPDVLGKATNTAGLLSLGDDAVKITQWISRMASRSGGDSALWNDLGNAWSGARTAAKNYTDTIAEKIRQQIQAACSNGQIDNDPYLVDNTVQAPPGFREAKGKLFSISNTTHVSLAKVLLQMVAKPILASGQFNEIQLVFYPMNEFAMFARNLNVGQYPINKKKLEAKLMKEVKKNPSLTIQKLLNLLKKLFVNFTGDDIYGMAKMYSDKEDEDGKIQILDSFNKDEKAKERYGLLKKKILDAAYPEPGAEKRFKKPSIQMWVECVTHESNPKLSILRLHFFDKAATSYSSYGQLWSAASSGDIGIIGKYTNAKNSLADTEKKLEGASRTQRQALLEQKRNRQARVNQYKDHFERQMKVFVDNKLIKEIRVKQDVVPEQTNSQGVPIQEDVVKYQITGGPDQLRGILAANMPTLKYGTEFSGILNASLQTNSDSTMETIHMQRQGGSGGTPDGFDAGLPLTVKPVTLSLDTFGCPYINFGQQFFVDFQTNTTIDDIYAVSGVSHSITPGEFKTSIQLQPLAKLGQYRNLQDQFDDAVAVSDATADTV